MALGFPEEKADTGKGSLRFRSMGRWQTNKTKYVEACTPCTGDIYRLRLLAVPGSANRRDLVRRLSCARLEGDRYPAGRQGCQGVLITILRRENARRWSESSSIRRPRRAPPAGSGVSRAERAGDGARMAQAPHRPPACRVSAGAAAAAGTGGFSGEEIAEQLGLNKNTVMTRLFRARNQIKGPWSLRNNREDTPMDERNFAAGPSLTPRTDPRLPRKPPRRHRPIAKHLDEMQLERQVQHLEVDVPAGLAGGSLLRQAMGSRRGAGGPLPVTPARTAMALPRPSRPPVAFLLGMSTRWISWPVAPGHPVAGSSRHVPRLWGRAFIMGWMSGSACNHQRKMEKYGATLSEMPA